MSHLQPLADAIWHVAVPHAFMGLHVGTRMTVVKLSTGGLLLHSPVPVDEDLAAELAALGEVKHIVCPNLFHHVFAAEVKQRYPEALLHGPAKLAGKRKDLTLDATLSETPHPDWGDDFELVFIEGSMLQETVFYHRASRTLIAADLIENFRQCEPVPALPVSWNGPSKNSAWPTARSSPRTPATRRGMGWSGCFRARLQPGWRG